VLVIEKPLQLEGPHIGTAWLSASERAKVRKALERINVSRSKGGESQTHQMPN
jgi:hypothetical protein